MEKSGTNSRLSLLDVANITYPKVAHKYTIEAWMEWLFYDRENLYILVNEDGELAGIVIGYFKHPNIIHIAIIVTMFSWTFRAFARRILDQYPTTEWLEYNRNGKHHRMNLKRLLSLVNANVTLPFYG